MKILDSVIARFVLVRARLIDRLTPQQVKRSERLIEHAYRVVSETEAINRRIRMEIRATGGER